MPAPLLLDLTHTSHTHARTGIQRVARSLAFAFGEAATPITHDPYQRRWRTLQPWERRALTSIQPASKRGAKWPLRARVGGRVQRYLGRTRSTVPQNSGLVVPELFSPAVAREWPTLFRAVPGPRVALFHDAIALKFPELSPAKTVARFPAYLQELLAFDGVAAVSEESRDTLVDYWRWLGCATTPPVIALPLGIDPPPSPAGAPEARTGSPPVILCVGSIEGRKNHLALLEACERLWRGGRTFQLRLVGLAQSETGADALARIAALQKAGHALRYDGPVSDAQLEHAYAECSFTVYPSLSEGFGLPVLESIARGKPCVCASRGALGESARGGGCLTLDELDAASLQTAIAALLDDAAELERLTREGRARSLRRWSEYVEQLVEWMGTLTRRM